MAIAGIVVQLPSLAHGESAANRPRAWLESMVLRAERFLCDFAGSGQPESMGEASPFGDNGSCLSRSVPVRIDNDTNGALAYFHGDRRRISLHSALEPAETPVHLVHELTHAYRHQFQTNESDWLDEGLAKLMEYRFTRAWPRGYADALAHEPDLRLRNDDQAFLQGRTEYASAFYLALYLTNRFGGDHLLRKLLQSKRSGWDNVLTSIRELQRSGDLAIDPSMISKKKILRHFAAAFWLNDAFAARYSLLSIDPHHPGLRRLRPFPVRTPPQRLALTDGEARIVYSERFLDLPSSEVFALRSRSPLRLEQVTRGSLEPAEVYIHIFE